MRGTPLGGPIGVVAGGSASSSTKIRGACGSNDAAVDGWSGPRIVRGRHGARGIGETTDRPFQTGARTGLGRGNSSTADRRHPGKCVALLSAAPVSVRRQVRLGDDRPQGPRGVRLPGDAARRPRHHHRQRQHRRHRLDVRRGRTAPAVDPLRLSRSSRGRATTASSSGPTPTRPTPIRASPRPCTRSISATC